MGISGFGNRGRWAVGVDDKRMCIMISVCVSDLHF